MSINLRQKLKPFCEESEENNCQSNWKMVFWYLSFFQSEESDLMEGDRGYNWLV